MHYRHIGLGHLQISDQAKTNVMKVLDENRLSYGSYTQKFESAFASHHGKTTSIFTASGTCALQMAIAALQEKYDYQDGDEVLVPAITFVATANVVLQQRLLPVFVDVDPLTYNIDPNEIEKHITARTRAIIPVHLFGLPCDMDPIIAIAEKHKLQIIEDSCETMFVSYKNRPVGSFGDYACFSTYVAHLLTTGVGGLLTMKDEQDEKLLRSIMQHGRDSIYLNIDDDDQVDSNLLSSLVERRFSFVRMGYSYRVTEMESALGLAALSEAPDMIRKRQAIGLSMIRKLSFLSDYLQLPSIPVGYEHAFMMFPIVLKKGNRNKFSLHLEKMGIETRMMMPLLNQPFYQKTFGDQEHHYPVAKYINENGLYIPSHHGMTEEDIDYIVSACEVYFLGA